MPPVMDSSSTRNVRSRQQSIRVICGTSKLQCASLCGEGGVAILVMGLSDSCSGRSLVSCLVNILTGHDKTEGLPHLGVTEVKPIAEECFAEAADKEECLAIGSEKKYHQKSSGSDQCVLLPVSDAVVVAGELLDQILVVANMVLRDNIELDFDTSEVLLSLQKLWKMTQHLPSVHGRKPMRLAQLETQLRSIDNWCTPENEHQLAKLIVQLAMQQRVVPPCEEAVLQLLRMKWILEYSMKDWRVGLGNHLYMIRMYAL